MLLLLVAAVAVAGCAAPRGTGIDGTNRPEGLPGVDPTRAYVTLNEIEPTVRDPVRPDSLKPLSGRAATLIAAAHRLVEQQRFTEAALKLERALRFDPTHPEIHRALAMLHWKAGNYERTRTHAAQALAANGDDATAHYLLARCEARGGDHAAAIAEFRTALRCSDAANNPAAIVLCHYHLAEMLAKEGYLKAALEQYEAFEQGATAVDSGEADEELRTLLRATGGHAAVAKSVLLETLGRYDDAADTLAPAVAASPEQVDLGVRYARLLARAHRINDALAAARAIPFRSGQALQLLADICDQSGHPERVVDELRAWRTRYPDEPSLFRSLSDALVRFDRADEALAVLQGYLQRHPDHHAIRMRLLDLLIARRAWSAVLRIAADGILRQPNRTEEIAQRLAALADDANAVAHILDDPPRPDEGFAAEHLRGAVAAAAGRLDLAEAQYRAALSQEPSFVPSRVALARVYVKEFRYRKALEVAARRDKDVAEDKRLEMVLGAIYERLDDLAQAERHFESATRLDASDLEAMLALARVYRRSGQPLRAQQQLRTLLERAPGNEEARESLAFMHLDERKVTEAIREFEELERSASTPTTRARAAAIIHRLEHQDAGAFRASLLAAMEESRPDAATWLAVAESYNEFAEPDQAREAFHEVLKIDPDNERALLSLARIDQKQLDFQASADGLKTLLKRRPNRHRWRVGSRNMRGLLELLLAMRKPDEILEIARRQEAREDLPDSTRVAYRLWMVEGLVLAKQGDDSIALLSQWSGEEPDNPLWSKALAEEYVRQDRPADAVSIYEAAFRKDEQDRDAANDLIDALVAADRYTRAGQYALDLLADDPGDNRALIKLTITLALDHRIDEALELIRNRLLTTIDREFYQNWMIRHLSSAGRFREEIEYIDRLLGETFSLMESVRNPQARRPTEADSADRIAHQPNEPFAIDTLHQRLGNLRVRLADAYIAAKEYNEAERQVTAWLENTRDPAMQFAYLRSLGLCRQIQGRDALGAETQEQALRLRPDDVTLNNDLAYTWIDQGVRLNDAGRMVRYAVWSSPRQGAYLDTYGWFLYKTQAYEHAKKWLLRAKRSDVGNDPVVLNHLGDVCWRLGENEEAVSYWEAAVEAVEKLDEDAIIGADVRRVRESTRKKVEAVRAGLQPEVAPLPEPVTPREAAPESDGTWRR